MNPQEKFNNIYNQIDQIKDSTRGFKTNVELVDNQSDIFDEWNSLIKDFLLKNNFKFLRILEMKNNYRLHESKNSKLQFCQLENLHGESFLDTTHYSWKVRYDTSSWKDKIIGLDHRLHHNINLFESEFNLFNQMDKYLTIDDYQVNGTRFNTIIKEFNLSNSDTVLLKDFVLIVYDFCQKWIDLHEQKEDKRLKELQVSQTNVLSELDKDGNGEVDVIEGNDFNLLLKKHQKGIVEVDRTYVQQFVKISSYLKTKEKNIQSIFNSIKDTPNQEVLNEYVEVLKDDIHSYNLILFNSLNMIVTLVEDDMITFYEIHEMFDTLNMFDSKHEKDVSQKLTNIGDGLKDLMYEIRNMGNQISDSIGELTYVTEQSNEQLKNQLSEIDSTMKVGNLISAINTYQNYKTNRRLNS